ncbi:MAG: hypothetical protein AAFP90_04305, partial [Planctomycetota bacterium]
MKPVVIFCAVAVAFIASSLAVADEPNKRQPSSVFLNSDDVAVQQQPNVLMLCIDDLNDWVGCLGGHPQTRTPNIDKLAARGINF